MRGFARSIGTAKRDRLITNVLNGALNRTGAPKLFSYSAAYDGSACIKRTSSGGSITVTLRRENESAAAITKSFGR